LSLLSAPPRINDDEKLLESSFQVPTECLGEGAAGLRAWDLRHTSLGLSPQSARGGGPVFSLL